MARNFKKCGTIKWEVTDQYGYTVDPDVIRDQKIGEILDTPSPDLFGKKLEITYMINLKKPDEGGWGGQYSIVFIPNKKMLKLYPLSNDRGERISLICNKLEDCEDLVKMITDGNKMNIMPAYIS